MAKSKIIPPSLQPRKTDKKPIPPAEPNTIEQPIEMKPERVEEVMPTAAKDEKKRFTLWLSKDVYRAFKLHTAASDGSASEFIERLLRKELKF